MVNQVYFLTNNRQTVLGQTLRECAFKIQQENKKENPKWAGFPVDCVLKLCADKGFKAGVIDLAV